MPESKMSLEVIVLAIFLISFLVDNVSASRTRVPSERTTFSSGAIIKAKGSLNVRLDRSLLRTQMRGTSDIRDALNDEEGNVGIRGNAALDALLVVLRQTVKAKVSRRETK